MTVNADNPLDLWAYVIVGIPGMIGAVFAAIIGWKSRASHIELAAQTAEIREQVSNDHASNLREDIDYLRALLVQVIARMDAHDESTREFRVLLAKVDERTGRIGDEVRTNQDLRRKADADIRRELSSAVERYESIIAKHHPEDAQ